LTETSEDVGTISWIRLIFVNSFLWLTGFDHATFYYSTNDYSLRRLLMVLLRLNLLPLLLITVSGEGGRVDCYPACFLHSFAYLLVYVTMLMSRHEHQSRQTSQSYVLSMFLLLLATSFAVSWAIPANESHGFVQMCRLMLPTLLGVSCASNRNELVALLKTLHTGPKFQANSRKCAVMLAFCLLLTAAWGSHLLIATRRPGLRPVLTVYAPLMYILVRNLVPGARDHVLTMFTTIGSMSLELYVLHRHILFNSLGADGLGTLFARYSKLSLLATGVICCIAARTAKGATTAVLQTCLFEMQRDVMLQVLLVFCSAFVLCFLLEVSNFFNSFSAVMALAVLGWTIYRIALQSRDLQVTPQMRILAPSVCCIIALLIGTCWHPTTLSVRTGTIGLDEDCGKAVHDGSWIQVDTCTDSVMEASRRVSGVSSLGTCQSLQWAWNAADPKCSFTHRASQQIRQELQNRTLTFIGDSEIRHLYYAFCRSVGDSTAGAYNTSTEKHSDISVFKRHSSWRRRLGPPAQL
jgi:10 TM Acyl Transferase domain found in Cas1p